MTLTVEMILRGTGSARCSRSGRCRSFRSSATMTLTYAPPELEVGTSGYGSVALRNAQDKPTIVPYGAGWVVKERAQDHAVGSGAFVER